MRVDVDEPMVQFRASGEAPPGVGAGAPQPVPPLPRPLPPRRSLSTPLNGVGSRFQPAAAAPSQAITVAALGGCWPESARRTTIRGTDPPCSARSLPGAYTAAGCLECTHQLTNSGV